MGDVFQPAGRLFRLPDAEQPERGAMAGAFAAARGFPGIREGARGFRVCAQQRQAMFVIGAGGQPGHVRRQGQGGIGVLGQGRLRRQDAEGTAQGQRHSA